MNYASPKEILDFCNLVRKVGGTNPLDALMPATPEDPNECLIARNLNFSCHVATMPGRYDNFADGSERWAMYVYDEAVAKRIGKALHRKVQTTAGLPPGYSDMPPFFIPLPKRIGNAAAAFDRATAETDDGTVSPLLQYVEASTLKDQLAELRARLEAERKQPGSWFIDAEEVRACEAAIKAIEDALAKQDAA